MPLRVPAQQQSLNPLAGNNVQLPTNRRSPVAEALQNLGTSLEETSFNMQRKRNAERLFAAEVALQDMWREKEVEIRQERRGALAKGVYQDTSDWWDTAPDSVISDVLDDSDAQREAFAQSMAGFRNSALNTISEYEAAENDRALAESSAASINSWTDFAASNAANPAALATAHNNIEQRVHLQADTFKWAPEREQFEMEKALTGMHVEVIQNLIDIDPEAARAYFDDNKDEINGGVYDSLNTQLGGANATLNGQRAFDDVMTRFDNYEERRAYIRENTEDEVRDDAIRRLDAEQSREERDRAANQRSIDEQVADDFFANGRNRDAISESQFQAASSAVKRMILEYPDEPRLIQTNWDKYWDLRDTLPQDPDMDLRVYHPDLNLSEQKELASLQLQIQAALAAGDDSAINGIRADTQLINDALDIMGIEDVAQRGEFARMVNERVLSEARTGEVSDERKEQIIRDLSQNMTWDESWFFPGGRGVQNVPVFQILSDPDLMQRYIDKAGVDSVPEQHRQWITDALRAAGQEPTDDAILVWYIRNLAGGF